MTDQWEDFQFALPHPWNTAYRIQRASQAGSSSIAKFQLVVAKGSQENDFTTLQNTNIRFSPLSKGEEISIDDNTSWARAQRSLSSAIEWNGEASLGQIWLIVYASFSLSPDQEQFRLQLKGDNYEAIVQDLISVGLAKSAPTKEGADPQSSSNDILILRGAFWQGAGSPFGSHPLWLSESLSTKSSPKYLSSFPLPPLTYTQTNGFPNQRIYARHPIRPAKPTPGSVIYSRYIPHLQEQFSMVALDYQNYEHLNLFHIWQNDPRVAQGWNETGTVEQHREYLRKLDEDQHIVTILAKFEETFFAYFEVYWAKVCFLTTKIRHKRGTDSLVTGRYTGRILRCWRL